MKPCVINNKYFRIVVLLIYSLLIFALNLKEPGLYSTQEGRAGVVARNMIRSGNYMSVQVKHGHTTEKPIFCYWLYALFSKIFGCNEIAVRLPGVISAVICVMLTYFLGTRLYGEITGWLSGFMLASMVSFANLARIARIDMVLCMFFTLSMVLFYKGYTEKRRPTWYLYLFYASLAVSVLVKGPVSVILAALVVFFYALKMRDWRIFWMIKPVSGLIIGLAIAGPWYVYESIRTNGAFALDFLWHQNVDRFLGINTEYCDGERKTFLFYIFNLFIGALPWSLFIPAALIHFRKRLFRLKPETYFLVFWFLAVFVFFSLSCIKRGDYILPLYPALAILLTRYIIFLDSSGKFTLGRYWLFAWGGFLCLALSGIVLTYSGHLRKFGVRAASGNVPFVGGRDGMSVVQLCDFVNSDFPVYVIALVVVATALFYIGIFFQKGKALKGAVAFTVFFLLMHSLFVLRIQPATDRYKSVRAFMLKARRYIPENEKVALFKIWNMEAIFYLDRNYGKYWTDTELRDPEREKLKYNYILCPPEKYEDIAPFYRAQTKILERTIEGHQYPMMLLGPRNKGGK